MDILIKNMEMPKEGRLTLQISANGAVYVVNSCSITAETYTTDAVPVPPRFEHVNGIPKTNGDRLRAMNNEELCNEYFRILNHVLGRYTDSRAGLLEWLKQPAE